MSDPCIDEARYILEKFAEHGVPPDEVVALAEKDLELWRKAVQEMKQENEEIDNAKAEDGI